MIDQPTHPFEMHPQGGGGFTVFEAGESVALPLLRLEKATLRGIDGQRMSFEFSSTLVVVEGEGLAELFGHLLAGRVKAIRCGKHASSIVAVIQIMDL